MTSGTVGPYRLERLLGVGAMGEVYLAVDPRLHRQVAIKILRSDRGDDPKRVRRRLLREARAAAVLSHPAIATVYDVVESEGNICLVMEYVPGDSLSTHIGRQPLAVPQTVRLAAQIASGLACAHDHLIFHGDLKPGNIIVTPHEAAKVLDFGLARQATGMAPDVGEHDESTLEFRIRGTPAYMAPEMLQGAPADARTDIYSLGVTMYEMVCGRRPYEAPDMLTLAEAIVRGCPPKLPPRVIGVSTDFDAIVSRAMARDPADRYPTAVELKDALEGLEAREASASTRSLGALPIAMASPGVARRGAMTVAALASLLAVLVGGLLWVIGRPPDVSATPLTHPVFAVLAQVSDGQEKQALASGLADVLVRDLSDATHLVIARAADTDMQKAASSLDAEARHRGASHLLTCAAAESPAGLTLHVELKASGKSDVLWSRSVSGKLEDVFRLQKQLSFELIRELRRLGLLSLTDIPQRRSPSDLMTSSVEAYAEYSQGRTFQSRPDIPGSLERAVGLFNRAIQRDPRFAQAHAALGRAALSLHNQNRTPNWLELARKETLEALRIAPDSPESHYSVAVLYANTGKPDVAREELQRVIEQDPENDDAHRLIGRLLVDAGDVGQGLAHLETARQLRPDFWDNYRALGLAYFSQGRYADAIETFRRLTELQPDSSWGFQTLGTALHAAGDRAQALVNYRKAIAIAPSARSYSNIGTLLYEQRHFGEAADSYQKALALRASDPMTHRNLGDALLRLRRSSEASQSYRKALQLVEQRLTVNPRDPETIALQAYCQARLGRAAEATSAIARAAALAPPDNDVLYERAVILTLADRPCDAIASLREAITRGYSVSLAAMDDDFAGLVGQPDFDELIHRTGPRGRWAGVTCR